MDHTKMYPKYLDSSRQELSNGCLGSFAALTGFSEYDFTCVFTGGAIQLYVIELDLEGTVSVTLRLSSYFRSRFQGPRGWTIEGQTVVMPRRRWFA